MNDKDYEKPTDLQNIYQNVFNRMKRPMYMTMTKYVLCNTAP